MYPLIGTLSVRGRVLLLAADDGDGGDGADGDGADRGGAGGRPEEAGHRHLPRPRPQLSLQLLGEKERNSSSLDSESTYGYGFVYSVLGPKLFFVTGLVIFATAVARLVCPDLLG